MYSLINKEEEEENDDDDDDDDDEQDAQKTVYFWAMLFLQIAYKIWTAKDIENK